MSLTLLPESEGYKPQASSCKSALESLQTSPPSANGEGGQTIGLFSTSVIKHFNYLSSLSIIRIVECGRTKCLDIDSVVPSLSSWRGIRG